MRSPNVTFRHLLFPLTSGVCGRRSVATWTPLGAAFNVKPAAKISLNFRREPVGLFGIPPLRIPEGFHLMREYAVHCCDDLIQETLGTAAQPSSKKRMQVQIFDELSDTLCQVADLAEFIRLAHPSQRYKQAAENACLDIGGLVERLNTNRPLYDALKGSVNEGDAVDQRVAELFLFDFEQSGIHLDDQKRKKVYSDQRNIGDYLTQQQMGLLFCKGILTHSSFRYIRSFSKRGSKVTVSSLHSDSPLEDVRETAYRLYLAPWEEQERNLQALLYYRHEMATLCGFKSYAERVLRWSLAGTSKFANAFLDGLNEELRPRTVEEFRQMESFKQSKEWNHRVGLNGLIREQRCALSANSLSPYFSLGACMEGVQMVCHALYGIKFTVQEPEPGELWSPDVYKLAGEEEEDGLDEALCERSFEDGNNRLLGHIYCDFYVRAGKPSQDCHFTIRGGRELGNGDYQTPMVVLHMNFPNPSWSCPTLLSPGLVDNLFHEMGHALHSLLGRTRSELKFVYLIASVPRYQHVSGTRCSTDLAEVPSTLMEHFAADPRVVVLFARHYKTREPIPPGLLEKLSLSRSLFAASDLQLQVFYSVLDQKLHDGSRPWQWIAPGTLDIEDPRFSLETAPKFVTTDVLRDVMKDTYPLPYVDNTAWQLRFNHLFGYGAKYYAYLMSRAVAASLYQKFFKDDPLSRSGGDEIRERLLSRGGEKDPQQMICDCLGLSTLTPKDLTDSLVSELDAKLSISTQKVFNC
ncbi:unnamed protein product [Cyprideis torosa]|uniref:Peptidase M3A/M3B catalytic domain-containing protein n=1 Tax=Cyprideis torosa TaxID=163714 RepID=A0A7R8ZM71_9CRUS|nr:unnamed protein product [Cyprideis torosa]CAG0883672.1 unnamed protein product [Cyprideis torosa]